MWGPYWGDSFIGAVIGASAAQDVIAHRSTDGGASWVASSAAEAGDIGSMAVWFDKETPGLTTNLIHVAWKDTVSEDFTYSNYNMETNAWSTPVDIDAAIGSTGNDGCFITRTRNGNLLAGYVNSASSNAYKSTDGGATWGAIANPFESNALDFTQGVTCNTGDDADGAILFWDIDADAVSVKVYDNSGDTWTESAIGSSMVEWTAAAVTRNWSVATFRSDGKAFLAAFNAFDSATADLKTWLLDINSVSAPTITAKTNVLTDTAEAVCPAVWINPRTDEVYVSYLTGTAYDSALNPFYKLSSDDGGTWGGAVALSDAAEDDYKGLAVGGTCGSNGGRMMPVWFDDDDNDILTSTLADVEVMSDTLVYGSPAANVEGFGMCLRGPYWISELVGAVVFVDSNADLVATKTSDGGVTWAAPVAAEAGTAAGFGAWFDRLNPGNTGTLIHCAWVDSVEGDFTYAAYDVNAGTWSTPVDIDAAASVGSAGNNNVFIAQTRAGGFVAGYVQLSTASGAFKSTDGVTWGAAANPFESNAGDETLGVSVDTGDTADSGILFNDTSVPQLSVKMYDDSLDLWVETAIGTSFGTSSRHHFNRATRLSDGHTIVSSWNNVDNATADLDIYNLTLNSIALPTVSALADAAVDSAESGFSGVFIDQTNDDIYVVYTRGSALFSLARCYSKVSTDDGTSWSSETEYTQQLEDDFRAVDAGAMGATVGGRFQPCFFDDDDNDLFVNLNNDVAITPAAGGGTRRYSLTLVGIG